MLKGKDIILFIENQAVALSTSCDIEISRDSISRCLGGWSKPKPKRLSWMMNGSFLMASDGSFSQLVDRMVSRGKIMVMFSSVETHPDGISTTDYMPDFRFGVSGYGYLSSIRMSSNNGDKTTYTLKVQGTGSLVPTR